MQSYQLSKTAMRSTQALTLALLLALGTTAKAETICADLPKLLTETADKSQIHCALTKSHASSMSRSISIVETEPEVEGVGFAINFEFGSAELTKESKALLATVAEVIAEDEILRKSAYFIDGHTDAVGSADANQALGQERAEAAAAKLLGGVDFALSLKVRSFGETELLDPDKPNSADNRRVEITPVSLE